MSGQWPVLGMSGQWPVLIKNVSTKVKYVRKSELGTMEMGKSENDLVSKESCIANKRLAEYLEKSQMQDITEKPV